MLKQIIVENNTCNGIHSWCVYFVKITLSLPAIWQPDYTIVKSRALIFCLICAWIEHRQIIFLIKIVKMQSWPKIKEDSCQGAPPTFFPAFLPGKTFFRSFLPFLLFPFLFILSFLSLPPFFLFPLLSLFFIIPSF